MGDVVSYGQTAKPRSEHQQMSVQMHLAYITSYYLERLLLHGFQILGSFNFPLKFSLIDFIYITKNVVSYWFFLCMNCVSPFVIRNSHLSSMQKNKISFSQICYIICQFTLLYQLADLIRNIEINFVNRKLYCANVLNIYCEIQKDCQFLARR